MEELWKRFSTLAGGKNSSSRRSDDDARGDGRVKGKSLVWLSGQGEEVLAPLRSSHLIHGVVSPRSAKR
jgi:hypothetical protein